ALAWDQQDEVVTEKFGAIACLLGAGYPDRTLDNAWRQLLFGQHHDAITGTPCDISYLDLMAGYREALELATKALRASIAFIARRVRTGGRRRRRPVIVFNPLAWDRTDVCRIEASGDGGAVVDADGNAVPCEVVARRRGRRVVEFLARDVPAVGYKTFYVTDEECGRVRLRRTVDGPGWNATSASSAGEPRRSRGPAAIGNEFFRVEVDPARGGGIVSLVDKRTGREFMRPDGRPANDLVALREKPDRNEPSWEFFTTGEKLFASDAPAIVEVRKGPLSSRLVVTSPLGTIASRRQEIVLREGVARIDFRTEILDYREPDNLFVVIFPNNLSNLQPVFEDRFGTLTRRRSRGYLDFRTHQMHMFSGCAVYSAQHFVDLGPSFAVLAQGSAGDDARGFPLGFCATVTGGSASDREAAAALAEALVKRGVTCTPWTDAVDRSLDLQDDLPWLRTVPEWGDKDEDLLYCDFRFSVGGPDVNAYTKRLLQRAPRAAREAFAAQLSATGRALLLLLDDAPLTKDAATPRPREPLPVLIIAGKTRSETREAVDDLIRRAEAGASLTIPDECNFAGQLPALDDSGLAVLNNGNIAASVECDGTLVLHLMHTAWWSRVQGEHLALGTEFVPEHKDHVFLYSLIPHAGDFRQADLPRRGWEFNNPLIPVWREAVGLKRPGRGAHASDAVIAGPDSADLASEKSFVRVEG
ncbi:MAG: glycoside hydrolase family 38 C-terminal domain-containing protein, partial [Armatimonadota bacterium]